MRVDIPPTVTNGNRGRYVPTLELYPFRFRDPLTGKWVRAGHKMQVPELQRAYGEWKIAGAPEMRRVTELSTAQHNPLITPGSAHAIIAPTQL